MKKHSIFYLVAMAALMACSSDNDNNVISTADDGLVHLTASPVTNVTRAADGLYTAETGFDGGEEVRVYFQYTPSDLQEEDYRIGPADAGNNYLSTLYRGTLRYPAGDTGTLPLWAVYPASSATRHCVAYDQTGEAAYKASDLMYATATADLSDKSNPVNLAFSHQLAKLRVVLTKDSEVGEMTTVTMVNVQREVTVTTDKDGLTLGTPSPATGTDSGEGNNILLNSVSITDATPHTFAVVFPPQAWNDEPFLTIVADGKTMTYYLTKDNFAAGHTYTLTLTVDNAVLRATNSIINWEVDEEPWTVTRYHQD